MAQKNIVRTLIDKHGSLYSEEMGATLARDEPVQLFHWLLGAILLSARISSGLAVQAGRGLKTERLHKVMSILESDNQARIRALNTHGYARYDTRTADYIFDAAERVERDYAGDLRRLRDGAKDADAIFKVLRQVKGIGATGASIFCREAQLVWDVLYPRIDGPAVDAAKDLGLPTEARRLVDLAGSRERFVRLSAALTRAALEGPAER